MAAIRLLGISGSLRTGAHSAAVLATVAEAAPAEVTIFPLHDVPLYNGDLDTESPPAAVAALRTAIAEADGLLVVTPEYNYGIPGVLKNALDWASRPGFASSLKDKPAVIISTSPGAVGGARAHAQVRETLSAALSRVVARPQIAINFVSQKVSDGRLTDEPALKAALSAVDDLLADIELLRRR